MANKTSQHILSTSANLLGFCLFVITSLHIDSPRNIHLIDELTSIVAVVLTFSCIFSFASIRTENERNEYQMERTADYLFVAALVGILVIILYIAFSFVS